MADGARMATRTLVTVDLNLIQGAGDGDDLKSDDDDWLNYYDYGDFVVIQETLILLLKVDDGVTMIGGD